MKDTMFKIFIVIILLFIFGYLVNINAFLLDTNKMIHEIANNVWSLR